jgi:hypothetical protein
VSICDQAVPVRVSHETDPRTTGADGVRRTLGLDALFCEYRKRGVQVVDGEGDVAVAGAELVAALRRVEVVGQFQLRALVTGNAEEVVDRLVADRQLASPLEPQSFLEGD